MLTFGDELCVDVEFAIGICVREEVFSRMPREGLDDSTTAFKSMEVSQRQQCDQVQLANL